MQIGKKDDADKKTAEEMRKVAIEHYGETRKRSEEENNRQKSQGKEKWWRCCSTSHLHQYI